MKSLYRDAFSVRMCCALCHFMLSPLLSAPMLCLLCCLQCYAIRYYSDIHHYTLTFICEDPLYHMTLSAPILICKLHINCSYYKFTPAQGSRWSAADSAIRRGGRAWTVLTRNTSTTNNPEQNRQSKKERAWGMNERKEEKVRDANIPPGTHTQWGKGERVITQLCALVGCMTCIYSRTFRYDAWKYSMRRTRQWFYATWNSHWRADAHGGDGRQTRREWEEARGAYLIQTSEPSLPI